MDLAEQTRNVLIERIAVLKAENRELARTVPFAKRATAALLGAFVGDSACLGTHWTYDPEEMAKALQDVNEPEFKGWEGSKRVGPFYNSDEFPGHYTPGTLSPYGEQLELIAGHLATEGKVEGAALADASYAWAKKYTGRPDHAIKVFVENMEKEDGSGKWPKCGADDNQAHCFIRAVPVTILYAGSKLRRDKVEEAIRVAQNNDMAVKFGLAASDILNSVLLGNTLSEALAEVQAAADAEVGECFAKATAAQDVALVDFLGQISKAMMKDEKSFAHMGRSCGLPGSFMGPLHCFIAAGDGAVAGEDLYIKSLRANTVAAGDTCSRSILLGAVLGAAAGSVPASWASKTAFQETVAAFSDALIKARK